MVFRSCRAEELNGLLISVRELKAIGGDDGDDGGCFKGEKETTTLFHRL